MSTLNFKDESRERALQRLEEVRRINAIANGTTVKKKTAKKTNKEEVK